MNNILGRKKIKVYDSISYSQIIFLVSSGENYPQKIAIKRKKEVSPTAKQMSELKQKDFLISINEVEEKNFPQNKKIYSVNWSKISEEFFTYYFESYQKIMQGLEDRANIVVSEITKEHEKIVLSDSDISFSISDKKEIIDNEHILFLLRAFMQTENILNNSTIRSIFERMSRLILSDKEIYESLGLKSNSLSKFLEVLKIVESSSVGIQDETIKNLIKIKLTGKSIKREHSLLKDYKNQYIFNKIVTDETNKSYLEL